MKILVTGANGFIGKNLVRFLKNNSYEVISLSRSINQSTFACDLLDSQQVFNLFKKLGDIQVLIHTAAHAHGQPLTQGYSSKSINVRMTQNLINNLYLLNVKKVIFLSSVSVYGHSPKEPIGENTNTSPATSYGEGKLVCENLFRNEVFVESHILRLPPTYDDNNLDDIKKRVFLPRTNIKIRVIPSPRHSFLHVSMLVDYIAVLLETKDNGCWIHQIADTETYSQKEILGWFKGIAIPMHEFILRPLYWILQILPTRWCKSLSESYIKFLLSNIYLCKKFKI